MSVQGRGGLNLVADPEGDVSIVRATVAGAAVVFVPVSVAKALGWIHVAGGRGLLWITDVDTVLLDVFAIGAIVLLAAHRDRARPHAPFAWFVVALAIGATLLFAFTMTNYGTLVRMRVMIATPLWLLPLALSPRREDDQPSNQQA